ncbi:MAG TPA: leucyl aminopeptidase [Bauldia sp.]|nr:leucyl aminopeptidase [Bauldia sp.]
MTDLARISFAKAGGKPAGILVVLADESLALGKSAAALGLDKLVKRAAAAADFKGKARSTLDLITPAGTDLDRLIVIGVGKASAVAAGDWINLGGATAGAIGRSRKATVILELPGKAEASADAAADFALGMKLRAYAFDNYRQSDEDAPRGPADIALAVTDAAAARAAWNTRAAIADGVLLARDLVNEPPNILGPVEFADRAKALAKTGLKVEVLTEKEMTKLGMRALLGVAQGSARPPRLVIMRWNGGKAKDAPVAFVGKGVVFDTGGISIKPAGGMEDMKGDMAGAAAVTGLMSALAVRKAKVNAIGVIGIVENMPDGNAQRPGDIVTAMTGKTIEIINTDAEGRLVLADAIAYTEQRFKPKFIIDLATLTGAMVVALGHQIAGMFASDDGLAAALGAAGVATGELVWRMPLGREYDKAMDSKFADVKNAGGRDAGSITAAHFIKRFVKDTPWVHLDIAGVALGSPHTDINRSWSSGWGVRLLDRLVADNYESK